MPFKWIRRWTERRTPIQMILLFYFFAMIISSLLLLYPKNLQEGIQVSTIDIIFTAVSALSVTGLSTIPIHETFSTTGIIILSFILQLGAVGIMTIGTFVWLILGKKIGLTERRLIKTDYNQPKLSGLVGLVKDVFILLMIIQFVCFLLLTSYFLKYFTFKESLLHGFFGTISALSNGGFDITGESLIAFQNDYFILSIHMILIILGAIGFPVLIEVKEYLFLRKGERKFYHFSLFTKVTTFTFFLLIVFGAIMIYILDKGHAFKHFTFSQSVVHSLFQSVTARSGGLSTLVMQELSQANQLLIAFLMFIGGSPNSTGGGIRTTTFALVIMFIFAFARGRKNIRLFQREIYNEDLIKAMLATLIAIILIFSSTLMLSIWEPFEMLPIFFEVTSAFGTVGLSLGITDQLKVFSKVILMILMFVGRVGVLTFLLMFSSRKPKGKYHLPKERIMIG